MRVVYAARETFSISLSLSCSWNLLFLMRLELLWELKIRNSFEKKLDLKSQWDENQFTNYFVNIFKKYFGFTILLFYDTKLTDLVFIFLANVFCIWCSDFVLGYTSANFLLDQEHMTISRDVLVQSISFFYFKKTYSLLWKNDEVFYFFNLFLISCCDSRYKNI